MKIFIKNGNNLTNQHKWITLPNGFKQLVPINAVSANTSNGAGNSGNVDNNNKSKNDKRD